MPSALAVCLAKQILSELKHLTVSFLRGRTVHFREESSKGAIWNPFLSLSRQSQDQEAGIGARTSKPQPHSEDVNQPCRVIGFRASGLRT